MNGEDRIALVVGRRVIQDAMTIHDLIEQIRALQARIAELEKQITPQE